MTSCRLPGCDDTPFSWLDPYYCRPSHRDEHTGAVQRAPTVQVLVNEQGRHLRRTDYPGHSFWEGVANGMYVAALTTDPGTEVSIEPILTANTRGARLVGPDGQELASQWIMEART